MKAGVGLFNEAGEQMADVGAIPNWEQRAGPGRPAGKPRWQHFTAVQLEVAGVLPL